MKNRIIFTLILIVLSIPAAGQNIVDEYIKLIRLKDYSSAESLWRETEREASKTLGITYRGYPLKLDCASPLFKALAGIRTGLIEVSSYEIKVNDSLSEIIVSMKSGAETIQTPYLVLGSGKSAQLISPVYYYSEGWPVYEGEFTRIHIGDSTRFNRYAAEELDREVRQIGSMLGLSSEKFSILENRKIDYFLCNEKQFEKLTGYTAHGLTVLQFDAIVSRHLPHPHELVHLLVNYALGDIPLYTVPFIQEGLAVSLGGRWGKSPAVVKQLGFAVLNMKMFTLEDILTFSDFYNKVGSADMSYPIAGIFVDMLMDQAGIDRFLDLYRDLSGSDAGIQRMSKEDIVGVIEKHTGLLWPNLMNLFNQMWPRYEYSGIIPGTIAPYPFRGERGYRYFDANLRLADVDDQELIELSYDSLKASGALLFNDPERHEAPDRSFLFSELLPSLEYEGSDYGLVFDTNEVGLYDFRTNILKAKYVEAFSPGRGYRYHEPNESMLILRIENDILPHPTDNINFELRYID